MADGATGGTGGRKRKKIGTELGKPTRIGPNTWVSVKRKKGDNITLDVIEERPKVESETVVIEQGDGI